MILNILNSNRQAFPQPMTTDGSEREIASPRPLVRPTRNQAEIDFLPPYGDPEVSIVGEFGTYFVVGAALTAGLTVLDRLRTDDG